MQLYRRLCDIRDTTLAFADDLARNLDNADDVAEKIKTTIDPHIEAHAIDAPHEARYVPVWQPGPARPQLDFRAASISAVIGRPGIPRISVGSKWRRSTGEPTPRMSAG